MFCLLYNHVDQVPGFIKPDRYIFVNFSCFSNFLVREVNNQNVGIWVIFGFHHISFFFLPFLVSEQGLCTQLRGAAECMGESSPKIFDLTFRLLGLFLELFVDLICHFYPACPHRVAKTLEPSIAVDRQAATKFEEAGIDIIF